jgi:hypothetical protein
MKRFHAYIAVVFVNSIVIMNFIFHNNIVIMKLAQEMDLPAA